MVFTRKIKFKVTFDWYTGTCADRFNDTLTKTYDLEKDYINREEAYRIGGNLEDWAERIANFKAIQTTSDFVGADEPIFNRPDTWLGITDVNGSTYSGCNITWEVISIEEPPIVVCPGFVKAEIARLERRKLRAIPEVARMIDVEIIAIVKEYNCQDYYKELTGKEIK